MKKLVVIIIGTNEEAWTAAGYLLEQDAVIYGFLSEKEQVDIKEILDIPVLGSYNNKTYLDLLKNPDIQYFIALKEPQKRIEVSQNIFKACNKHPISIIHPTAYVARSASLAYGVMIGPYCSISERVSIEADTFIGSHVVIGANTQIDRACVIQSGSILGNKVIIEKNVFIGLNATIHHHIKLEENAVVMSGATVFQSVKKGNSVIGNPAQIVKPN